MPRYFSDMGYTYTYSCKDLIGAREGIKQMKILIALALCLAYSNVWGVGLSGCSYDWNFELSYTCDPGTNIKNITVGHNIAPKDYSGISKKKVYKKHLLHPGPLYCDSGNWVVPPNLYYTCKVLRPASGTPSGETECTVTCP